MKKNEIKRKILKPTNDYIFKRLFGYKGNEDILKGLLSAIMQKEIKNINLDKNRILEKDLLTDKIGILDIRATLNDDVECDIEVQVINPGNIQERILYYWSTLYSKGIVSGEDYENLKKVIIILITGYELEEMRKIRKTLTKWQIREENYPKEVLTDKLEFYILELPKYKKYRDVSEELGNWVKFIESPEEINMEDIKDENIKKAKKELETINMDEYEEEMARRREIFLHDQTTMKARAYEDGEKVGLEKRKKSWNKKRRKKCKNRNSKKIIK